MDDSDGRAYELQQAAVKCMRGILFCYMRQADKVSFHLRTVPTIVIAHTFCASPDITPISYHQCLLIQGYFCVV